MYLKVQGTIKEVKRSHTLTADVCTSGATEAYRGMSCHFISDDWQMKTLNLATMQQQQMSAPQYKLIQDVSSRWNSTYHMIEVCSWNSADHLLTLSDPEVTPGGKHYFDLKPDQWLLREELTQGLQPFKMCYHLP